jgi:ribonucleoside-diphosphate reductase alpha chain
MPYELPTPYQQFIAKSRYARWLEDKQRRETWDETINRYLDFFFFTHKPTATAFKRNTNADALRAELYEAMGTLQSLPSMRCLMTAGPALEKDNIAGFNCSYLSVDDVHVFSEMLYILLNGVGAGFSVERQYINKLPDVPDEFYLTETTIVVDDSKLGWAKSFHELVTLLYQGQIPKWDMSRVRPSGARLKTFGGRASGPEPLDRLFKFTVSTFKNAAGRKLESIECHDLLCMIGEIVVVGGVRRSATLSLSNLSDLRMRDAKSGNWWEAHPHRKLANNSVAYTERPELVHFMEEWVSLYKSHSGERGIVNREALRYGAKKYGKRDPKQIVGVNPCCEVTLRSMQFCNLSTIILRPEDTREVILKKVRIAAIFGTMQATLTSFRFLRKKWKQNTEEEALLGVSMTGILDHPLLGALGDNEERDALLREMREVVEAVNAEYADLFGINHATACTAIKPEGTVSELVDSASGIHPRWSEYYLRSVRGDNKDPLTQFLRATGIRYEPEIGKEDSTTVFYFAKKSPDTSVTRDRITAIQQLELWKTYQVHYCEHKPSITVYVREDEWLGVAAWVWENFDIVSGVSFLPYDNGVYQQAPYNAATENEYLELLEKTPNIDWQMLEHFEKDDEAVNGTREYACVSGACELR